MIKFIKSLFAPAVEVASPVVETVKAVEVKAEAPAKAAPKAKKPAVKKATTRKPKATK